jgi:outer membrane protein
MKSLRFSVLIILLWAAFTAWAQTSQPSGASSPGRNEPQSLTLSEAVRVALEKNPSAQAADAYAEAVEKGIAEARAGHAPRIDFSEGFARSNNPVFVFGSLLTQRQFTSADFALNRLNTPTPLDNFRTQFTATMPLFDAGQTRLRVRDAKLGARGAAQARQRARQQVVFDVVKAYNAELLARASLSVAEATVQTAQSDLNRAQARQDQGLAVPSDLLSAKVQLAQAQQDLLQARSGVSIAHAALNVAMGLPEDAEGQLAGGLGEVTFQPGSLSDRQRRALEARPDYLELSLGGQKAETATRLARTEFLPKLNLLSSWEEDNQTFAARGGNNWMLGASLNFNLFDGGANRARLAAARALQRQSDAQLAQMAAAVRLQVREAYLNVGTAQDRVQLSRQARSEAEESLRIIQNRYESGLATITDLLRAEAANTAAQRNYLNSLFDYRIGFAALELATGELAPNSAAVSQ